MNNEINNKKNDFLNIYKIFKKNYIWLAYSSSNDTEIKLIKDDPEKKSFLLKNYILTFYIEIWSFYNKMILDFFCNSIDESWFRQPKINNLFMGIVFSNTNSWNFNKNDVKWDDYEKTYFELTRSKNSQFNNIYAQLSKEKISNHFVTINSYRNYSAHGNKYKNTNSRCNVRNSSETTLINQLLSDVYLLNLIFNRLFNQNQ
jgi:hypothetical protein